MSPCDHIIGAVSQLYALMHRDTQLVRESEDVTADELAEVFDYCPECGANLAQTSEQEGR